MEQDEIRKMAEAEMWRLHLKLTQHFLNLLEQGDGMKGSTYKEICDFLSQNGINLKEKPARSYSDEGEDLYGPYPFLEDGSRNPEFERSLNVQTYL
jgi:hypothetical protein